MAEPNLKILQGQQSAHNMRRGKLQGFSDPSPTLSPSDLYGQGEHKKGAFFEMRRGYHIIAHAFDRQREYIELLDFEVIPRVDSPSKAQVRAAVAIDRLLSSLVGQTKAGWIASVIDRIDTYGHALDELVGAGDRLRMRPLLPWRVREFVVDDETRDQLQGVALYGEANNYHSGIIDIDAFKLSWFGRKVEDGDYYGHSILRPLLALFQVYKQDLHVYMGQQIMQRGVPYVRETEGTAGSHDEVIEWLEGIYTGEPFGAILPRGYDPGTLVVQSPALSAFREQRLSYNAEVREYLNGHLNNMGMQGVGARALGETVDLRDADRFVKHVNSSLCHVNGDTHYASDVLRRLTALCGFDPDTDTPMLVARGNSALTEAERRASRNGQLVNLTTSGVLQPEDIPSEVKREVLGELFDLEALTAPDADAVQPVNAELAAVEMVPKKYAHIDFKPSKEMREAAKRGLEYRKKAGGKGGTAVGVARGRDVSNGRRLSPETVRDMHKFFSRHQGESRKIAEGKAPHEDKGYVAWLLWGGDAGRAWARKRFGQMRAADENE